MALALEKSGSIADHRSVARWVRRLAHARLADTSRLIDEMEADLRSEVLPEVFVPVSEETAAPEARVRPPRRVVAPALIAIAVATAALGAAFVRTRSSRAGPTTPSETLPNAGAVKSTTADASARDITVAATMTVDRGGRWFEIDGVRVDISRRRVLRRIVIALVRRREASPGEEIETNELLAAGWPGERVMPDAAGRRVRTAIWELRRMGLGRSLTTKGFGYAIEPSTSIVWSDAPLLAGDAVR